MSTKQAPILVGIDFSASSSEVLKQAAHISSVWDSPVIAVHILDSSALEHWSARGSSLGSEDELKAQARERLESLASDCEGLKDLQFEVAIGEPAGELAKLAEEKDAWLLVIAANDRTKDRLGSVASRCVRKVKCDVMIERKWHRGHFEKIIVCTDLKGNKDPVLERAIKVASANKATLEIVHVAYPPERDYWGEQYEADRPAQGLSYAQRVRAETKERLERCCSTHEEQLSAIKHETRVIESTHPAIALNSHIASSGAQLVVLGTRHKGKIAGFFGGTNAERLMHDVPVSVLAVRV
ncbi:MAG: universal stress protein [Akkermansiaceae bacterium]|nr:universal stress protein [Akkermansiaceae bacterium]